MTFRSWWSKEETKALIGWRDAGLPASRMVAKFFECFRRNVTRNAIIGRLSREAGPLKVQPRQAPQPRRLPPAPRMRAPARRPPISRPPPKAVVSEPISLMDLQPDSCRWPVQDDKYCGARAVSGRPYCLSHCRIAYNGFR